MGKTKQKVNRKWRGLNQDDGIQYNPRIHKQLTCDKVISIVPKGGLWRELVGVYWKGTDGASVLFETTPSKADKIIKIFNGK